MAAMPNKPNANWIKWQTKNGIRPQKGKTCLPVQSPVGQQPEDSVGDDDDDDDVDDCDDDDADYGDDDDDDDDDDDGYLGNPLPKKDQRQHSLLTRTMTGENRKLIFIVSNNWHLQNTFLPEMWN